MSKKYKCFPCNYITNVNCNYKKHLVSIKHINNQYEYKDDVVNNKDDVVNNKDDVVNNKDDVVNNKDDTDDKYEIINNNDNKYEIINNNDNKYDIINNNDDKYDIINNNYGQSIQLIQSSKSTCQFCSKILSKSNISKHHKICQHKNVSKLIKNDLIIKNDSVIINKSERERITQLETEISNLKLKNELSVVKSKYEQAIEQNKDYLNLLKHNSTKSATISNSCNMYYIMNNCSNALNYDDIMTAPLTIEEMEDLDNNSAIVGPINLLRNRCIDSIELHERPFHLVDESRKKYYVRVEDDWVVDIKGDILMDKLCELLKTAYLTINKDDTTEMIVAKNKKYKNFYDNRGKILDCVKDQILLKNNSKLMIDNE
jgi:K+/H+ antiporter YhaU regulatory subunit KhtT